MVAGPLEQQARYPPLAEGVLEVIQHVINGQG